ncbi:uncharacterized protein AKAW2_70468A [Aspergillus luchuensis]|uniref:Uncharacterized protein n=1 Tax=Aspergillus kawachii TaxID=1069201 RepID=A0A7R7WJ60_ASPKA|nr:uncharacterized protein AKAW2_70468A [Aspergillus luchuensis]BCS03590.1 hypothetical protein AKAW2_70468A [Aspergillus luchuensis]
MGDRSGLMAGWIGGLGTVLGRLLDMDGKLKREDKRERDVTHVTRRVGSNPSQQRPDGLEHCRLRKASLQSGGSGGHPRDRLLSTANLLVGGMLLSGEERAEQAEDGRIPPIGLIHSLFQTGRVTGRDPNPSAQRGNPCMRMNKIVSAILCGS